MRVSLGIHGKPTRFLLGKGREFKGIANTTVPPIRGDSALRRNQYTPDHTGRNGTCKKFGETAESGTADESTERLRREALVMPLAVELQSA